MRTAHDKCRVCGSAAAHCSAGYPPDTYHRKNVANGLSSCALIHDHARSEQEAEAAIIDRDEHITRLRDMLRRLDQHTAHHHDCKWLHHKANDCTCGLRSTRAELAALLT
jgi:hypothetical protein